MSVKFEDDLHVNRHPALASHRTNPNRISTLLGTPLPSPQIGVQRGWRFGSFSQIGSLVLLRARFQVQEIHVKSEKCNNKPQSTHSAPDIFLANTE